MILAHRIALDPTCKQLEYFVRAAGCDRFVWNLALEQWNAEYVAGGKPRATELKKRFNATKYRQYPWMAEMHRDAHADPFARLQKAWVAHFKNPKRTGRPIFHKKGRHDSFYVANDKLEIDGYKVRLPVLGWVRMREKLRFDGKIMGARVSRQSHRWFMSIQVEMGDTKRERTGSGTCGVDLGIKSAATIVHDNGNVEHVQAPKPLAAALGKLRRMQRSVSRRTKGGSNRGKLVTKVARLHARTANTRRDFWDKLTTRLCRENQAVGMESLNVRGMVRNRRLSRALADVGIGMFGPRMEYKSALYGTKLVMADRWYPSSKTCSRCEAVRESLPLSERVFHCEQCGLVMDRDENAATNLRHLANDFYPRLEGNLRLGRGRAGSVLGEPGTKRAHSCAQIRKQSNQFVVSEQDAGRIGENA